MNDRDPTGPGSGSSDDRISRLSAAILRISQSLDVATVLREAVEGACALTGTRSGAVATVDERGRLGSFVTFGASMEERRKILEWPDAPRIYEHLRELPGPVRVADLPGYLDSLGLSPTPWASGSLHGTPMHHRGEYLGHFFLGDKEDGEGFTDEDEEILVLFASQAATAIANARTYRDLERARADLEALIETSPVGVAVFDAGTGHPVSFNREARRIVEGLRTPGRPPEQLLEVITCRHSDGREVSLEELPLARQLGSATTMRAEEVELSVPDGRSVRMLINVTPIRSEEGGVVSVVVTMQDLAPLDELERQRAEFLGMVSHELRAPLTSIKGSTATVLGAVPLPPQAELLQFFRIIDGQADHMRGLIANLLDAGSIEAGTLTVAPEPANVAALVDRARSTFLSGGGRHAVLIDLPPDLPRAMADRERIVQVMNNLFSNAARHAPASSPIRVEATCEGGYIALSVSDEGRGIPPDRLPHLFHKRAGLAGGTGLGLAICEGPRGGARRPYPGRERGDGPGRALHLHDPGGRAGRPRGGPGQRPATPARGRAGEDSRPGRGRRPADATLRAQRPLRCGLRPARDGRSGRTLRRHPRREAPPRPPRPDAPRNGRDRADEAGPRTRRSPGHLHLRLRPRRDDRQGARERRRRLHRQAVLADRARRARPGGATEPGRARDLRARGARRRLRPPTRVSVAGREVPLTATEFDLLRILSLNGGRVVTTEALLRQVWGRRGSDDTDRVRTVVKKLRHKLGDDAANPTYIFNEHGVGYRFATPGGA